MRHSTATLLHALTVLLFSLALTACERAGGARSVAPEYAPAAGVPLLARSTAAHDMAMAGQAAGIEAIRPPPVPGRSESLAYEHYITVELTKATLPKRMEELQTACNSNKDLACTLLDYSTSTNESVPSGNIRMRLAPAGVSTMIDIAGKGGELKARNTHAEDLAEPIADTERQLALMTTHRDRLAEFMKSKDIKVEQLITVSKELATVQSQIDALGTQRANLRRRVDTELLTINLTVPMVDHQTARSPITDAFRSFGIEMRDAVADVILFVASILPWLVILLPGLVLLRLFWRWIGRWIARRELRTPANHS